MKITIKGLEGFLENKGVVSVTSVACITIGAMTMIYLPSLRQLGMVAAGVGVILQIYMKKHFPAKDSHSGQSSKSESVSNLFSEPTNKTDSAQITKQEEKEEE